MMSKPHAFDSSHDNLYDINSFPDVFLTEEQVSLAMQNVSVKSERDSAVCELIFSIEKMQRDKCLGQLSRPQMVAECQALNKIFRARFGGWAYATNAYKAFYSQFGVIEE